MKDRSQVGVRFIAGLALALSLAAQACVAGEVGDEDEIEGARPVPEAVEARTAVGPAAREEQAPAADPAVDPAVDPVVEEAPEADQAQGPRPTEAAHVEQSSDVERRLHPHKLDVVIYADPPPFPW